MGLDHYGKVYNVKERELKLQLWDTGGMERVASITSSYYKYSEAAILVFALDNPDTFHILSQHLLDIVTYAENAKIFLCGNKYDQKSRICITDSDMEAFSEQCHNLVSGIYKTSCKTGEGVEEMFNDIAKQLIHGNRSRIELQNIEERSFHIAGKENTSSGQPGLESNDANCSCDMEASLFNVLQFYPRPITMYQLFSNIIKHFLYTLS